MTVSSSHRIHPSAVLAKSLLDVWLSGNHSHLSGELERVAQLPDPPEMSDESDRIELLKGIARRMQEVAEWFKPCDQSPGTGAWLDLLGH